MARALVSVGEKMMTARRETDKGEKNGEVTARPPKIMSDDRILLAWQRSHMANERTFLAWCRTSIALLAFGFVIERLDIFLRHLLQLGDVGARMSSSRTMVVLSVAAFLLAGSAILISGLRFLRVRRHINLGEPSFSVMPDVLVIISVVVITIIAILLSLPRLYQMAVVTV